LLQPNRSPRMLATATAPGHMFDLSHQCVSL
jgi:hypothetical protein